MFSQAALNATLNGPSAVLLTCGYAAIRARKIAVHKAVSQDEALMSAVRRSSDSDNGERPPDPGVREKKGPTQVAMLLQDAGDRQQQLQRAGPNQKTGGPLTAGMQRIVRVGSERLRAVRSLSTQLLVVQAKAICL